MLNLKELRLQRATKAERGRKAVEEYNVLVAKADRSADDDAKLEALDQELTALEAAVDDLDAQIEAAEKATRRQGLFTSTADTSTARRGAFGSARTVGELNPERTGGFASMAEFGKAVANANVNMDARLAALPNNYNVNGGSAGEGFMVPPQFAEVMVSGIYEGDDLINRIAPEPTASNHVQLIKDETTPWGASGVQAYWRAEGAQLVASKVVTQGVQVPLHELYAFVVATDELLADSPRLNDRLSRKSADAIRWKVSDEIMWGNGVGRPQGFMEAASLVTVSKETGQAADTINATNVAKMFSRLLPGNIGAAFWMINPDALPQIMLMTIGDQPIWTPPAQGFAQAPGGFLLGRPIMLSEHSDTVGDLGDITLVDPAGYYGATKQGGGIEFASSMHLFFDYGAQAFRWTFRFGGTPILASAVTPPRSSNTKSHFVALEAR